MKIRLTPEQIEQIVTEQKEVIQTELDNDIAELKRKFEAKIKGLGNKYSTFDIELRYDYKEPTKVRTKIDKTELIQLLTAKKSIKEIALHFNKPESSVRQKMINEKLHIKDYK